MAGSQAPQGLLYHQCKKIPVHSSLPYSWLPRPFLWLLFFCVVFEDLPASGLSLQEEYITTQLELNYSWY